MGSAHVVDRMKSSKALETATFAARVGTVIRGKWTIDRLLGVGGMAAVYGASHRNGKRVALKILHASLATDPIVCERFLREAYVSNKVNHSAAVQVMDDDVTEQGEPFLIMDLLDGETVRDAWKKAGRTMPIGRALQICERIADCLASCHAIGIVHRDLKPANVFITHDGEVKLIDFGVAQMRALGRETSAAGTAFGTPAYMSPEQAMGLVDKLDGRSDLFSLGAMLHALTTGHRINAGRTEQEALRMAATKPVPSVALVAPHLPPDLIRTIDKSLSWDRKSRFKDAREMQGALLELMPAHGVRPLPSRPPPHPNEVVAPPPPPKPVFEPAAESASPQIQSQVVATTAAIATGPGMSPSAFPADMPEVASSADVVEGPAAAPSAVSVPDMDELLEAASSIEEREGHSLLRAPVELPAEPTAHGSLALTPIPHVLVYMLDHVLTGTVVLDGLPGDNVLYFRAGVPVKMYLSEPVSLLGEVFVQGELVSPDVIEASAREARRLGVLLGEHLVAGGIVTRDELDWALETQLLQNLTKLANLPGTMTYSYYGDVDLLQGWGDEKFAPSSALNPALVCVRHWADHARITATLARLGGRPLALHRDAEVDRLALLPDEQLLLETLRLSEPSLGELRSLGLAPEATVSSLVYMLAVTRQLECTARSKGPMGLRARLPHDSTPPESIQPLASIRPSAPVPSVAPPSSPAALAPVPSVAPSSSESAPSSPPPPPSVIPSSSSRPREATAPDSSPRPSSRMPAFRPASRPADPSSEGPKSPSPPQIRPIDPTKATLVRARASSLPPEPSAIDEQWFRSLPPPAEPARSVEFSSSEAATAKSHPTELAPFSKDE